MAFSLTKNRRVNSYIRWNSFWQNTTHNFPVLRVLRTVCRWQNIPSPEMCKIKVLKSLKILPKVKLFSSVISLSKQLHSAAVAAVTYDLKEHPCIFLLHTYYLQQKHCLITSLNSVQLLLSWKINLIILKVNANTLYWEISCAELSGSSRFHNSHHTSIFPNHDHFQHNWRVKTYLKIILIERHFQRQSVLRSPRKTTASYKSTIAWHLTLSKDGS